MLQRITLFALLVIGMVAQEAPKQEAGAAQAGAAVQPSPVYEYDGKPIMIPYHCSLEDVRWAGMTCSESEPCPMYLELSSADAVGDHVFAAGNIHSDAVTLYSMLLTSGDGGHSWQVQPDNMRGAGLEHIQFLDALTGW